MAYKTDIIPVDSHDKCQPGKEKGEFMRKGIARRCLCIALASAMVFGDVGIASAAESNAAASKEAVSVAADESIAEVAASTPEVEYLNVNEYYGDTISVNAVAYAYKTVLLVNGKKYDERTSGTDNGYNGYYLNINSLPGTTYTVELRYSNKDGKVYKLQKKITTASVVFKKTSKDAPTVTATSVSGDADANGIMRPAGVEVTAKIDNPKGKSFTYEVYRSSKPSGGYTRIGNGVTSSDWRISYTDTKVKSGSAYYYKFRILRGTDQYVAKDKVLAVSSAAGVRYGVPECYIYNNGSYGKNEGKKAVNSLLIGSSFANQYDLYRSTNKAKGYKKIATVYGQYYEDTNIKKGTVYYYKAVPKYYDSKTGKTATGKASEPKAIRYLMDAAGATLTQVSATSMKCEWYAENSSDVSYEIWYKRDDLDGDAYRKAAVTKKKSCVLKNLAADGEYSVKVRTVKKAGAVVKYEDSYTGTRTMGYTTQVQDLYTVAVKSSADTKKGVVAVYYKMSWYKDWGASGYYIKAYNRYTGKTETIKKLSAKATSYTFRNVADKTKGLKYTDVQVIPYKGKTMGGASYSLSNNRLPAVSRVKVTRKSGTSVLVAWTAVPGAKTYVVKRRTALGVTQTIASTTATKFVDTHVTNGMEYIYTVYPKYSIAGFYEGDENGFVTYTHALSRPAISSGVNSSAGTAAIKWGKIANAKCYKVYRSDKANGKYVQVAKTSHKVMVYADKKLKKGKTYYYKVVAYTVNGCGKVVKSSASSARAVKIKK